MLGADDIGNQQQRSWLPVPPSSFSCSRGYEFGIHLRQTLAMARLLKPEPKKPYKRPKFVVYGTTQQLKRKVAGRDAKGKPIPWQLLEFRALQAWGLVPNQAVNSIAAMLSSFRPSTNRVPQSSGHTARFWGGKADCS